MAYFLIIFQLLIHSSASFWSYSAVSKHYMVLGPKVKD